MANTLDPMDLKQIVTLHIDGLSNRKIGTALDILRNTINNYIRLFKASDYTPKELLGMEDTWLSELFPSNITIDNDRYNKLMRYFERVNEARHHPCFTFQFHYLEYSSQARTPYSYTQFIEHYNRKHANIKRVQ